MSSKQLLQFQIFCSTSNLKEIREKVQNFLKESNIIDPDQYLIVLAVDEICSNSMIHGNKENPNKKLKVQAMLNNNVLNIEISDEGRAFNYDSYQTPEIRELVQLKSKGSMGLMLVNKIMDNIEFLRKGNTNICRLSKKMTTA